MQNLTFFTLLFFILLEGACLPGPDSGKLPSFRVLDGETMGTYYRITYNDTVDIKKDIDFLLEMVNQEVSTYIPNSLISLFNREPDSIFIPEGIFLENYRIARMLYEKSGGLYDPTVMPLVNYWGFGYSGKKQVEKVDSQKVAAISLMVGMSKIHERERDGGLVLIKTHPGIELDFSSVAKGYAVDILGQYLDQQGINHYLVDIGGEMLVKGKNPKSKPWSIGINTPIEHAGYNEAIRYLALTERALATSGNYRNFYESGNLKVSHTINPITGFPERSSLLSVSVLAPNCALADAWATTCMVSGMEKAKALLKKETQIDACFIYEENGELRSIYINQFKDYIVE